MRLVEFFERLTETRPAPRSLLNIIDNLRNYKQPEVTEQEQEQLEGRPVYTNLCTPEKLEKRFPERRFPGRKFVTVLKKELPKLRPFTFTKKGEREKHYYWIRMNGVLDGEGNLFALLSSTPDGRCIKSLMYSDFISHYLEKGDVRVEQKIEEAAGSNLWVKDLSNYRPISSNDSHWGRGQAGFNLSRSGRIYLTDNSEKDIQMSPAERLRYKAEHGLDISDRIYPTHRDFETGMGANATVYGGIYTFEGKDAPTLWLYPHAERAVSDNPEMSRGLASLIGVHKINRDTPVRSNSSRKVLFKLGDLL